MLAASAFEQIRHLIERNWPKIFSIAPIVRAELYCLAKAQAKVHFLVERIENLHLFGGREDWN